MFTKLTTLPHFHAGKVRDTFRIPAYPELLFMNASMRASSHNVKHKTLFPGKGELLTAQMIFWVRAFPKVQTHVVASGSAIWNILPYETRQEAPELEHTGIVVWKRKPHKREFVWRNYLTGSLYRALQEGPDPYGLDLDRSLPKMHRFAAPIFTPTMKSADDEPVHAKDVERDCPGATALTKQLFTLVTDFLDERDIVQIDGKMEATELMIVDELATGDSTRLARKSDIREGEDPPFLDKERLRKLAEAKWGSGTRTPLEFSDEEVREVMKGYHEAFELITGKSLLAFQKDDLAYQTSY